MKKTLLKLLVPLVLLVSGCEKRDFDIRFDLNGDGEPETIIYEKKIDRKNAIFYLKNNDTVYLHKSPKTFTWGFGDFIKGFDGLDGLPDFFYFKGNKTIVRYNNGDGTFSEEQRFGQ